MTYCVVYVTHGINALLSDSTRIFLILNSFFFLVGWIWLDFLGLKIA